MAGCGGGRSDAAGFGAISPLEPLDPTKFRNIMVEKQESLPHNAQVHSQESSKATKEVGTSGGSAGGSIGLSKFVEPARIVLILSHLIVRSNGDGTPSAAPAHYYHY